MEISPPHPAPPFLSPGVDLAVRMGTGWGGTELAASGLSALLLSSARMAWKTLSKGHSDRLSLPPPRSAGGKVKGKSWPGMAPRQPPPTSERRLASPTNFIFIHSPAILRAPITCQAPYQTPQSAVCMELRLQPRDRLPDLSRPPCISALPE